MAVRYVLPCRSHGKQRRCVILLQGREQIVVNNNISYHSIDKYFNVVPLFDLLFFPSSRFAEMQAIGSCYIFYCRAEFSIFHIKLTIFGYSGRVPKLQQNLRTICSNPFSTESNCCFTKLEDVIFLKNVSWKGNIMCRRLLSFIRRQGPQLNF